MGDGKVSALVLRAGLFLEEHRGLSKQVLLQFIFKRLVRRLGKQCFFFKNGKETHGLLHELDGGLEVHTEVNHLPFDALPNVLLLLQHEHVVVEELLQLLVTEVDTDLLEGVELEYLEASNVEDTDKVDFLHGGVDESAVAHVHQVTEQSAEDVLDDGGSPHGDGCQVLSLVDPLCPNLTGDNFRNILITSDLTLYFGLMKQS